MSRLLTRSEAAKILKIHVVTCDTLRKSGQLPCVHIGKKIFFTEELLQRFIESGGTK
jgi:excisionase family DNA binding protein